MALLSASGSAAGSGPATEERQELLSAVIDVPQGGSHELAAQIPMQGQYGAVVVHVLPPLTSAAGLLDPAPENDVSFRVIDPGQAPDGYRAWLVEQCGHVCRGH